MKKLTTTLVAVLLCSMAIAQIQKGARFLGGSVSYNSSNSDNDFSGNTSISNDRKTNNAFIEAGLGFLVTDKTGIGFSLGYNNSTSRFTSDAPSTFYQRTQTYFLNVFVQQFLPIKDDLLFAPRLQVGYGFGNVKNDEGSDIKNNRTSFQAFIAPEIKYFLNSKWALSGGIGSIGYSRTVEELSEDVAQGSDQKNIDQGFSMSFNINTFSLGIEYYLNNSN